ncbi:E3 ubiquitin-protein ligase CCNB1IP1 homolog isoform X3 [Malania oleifera]|nr:E3 ubiquitin-protein ligase CCNB1IP1 homolog isoform X3 [Malania oleifera]
MRDDFSRFSFPLKFQRLVFEFQRNEIEVVQRIFVNFEQACGIARKSGWGSGYDLQFSKILDIPWNQWSSLKTEMRCNACWRELDGQAITTICGHLLCTEDAAKILNNDAACPICDQVLSKSLLKPVDINPNDEWINMSMAGISPQILMKSAYRSVMFYIGQKELEMQFKMNRVVAQCRQKCEVMQEKFTEKLEQVHTAYQKMAKRCQLMEQEMESLSKDKQELQEKFSEKSRQKRKLDEMYDQLRNEYESMKRSAIQPASNFYSRPEPDLFSNPTMMDNRDPVRKDWPIFTPETPGPREDIWPARQNSSGSGTFDISGCSPGKQAAVPADAGNRRTGAHPIFGGGGNNPSMTLRNLIISPIKRPQLSRNRTQMFT